MTGSQLQTPQAPHRTAVLGRARLCLHAWRRMSQRGISPAAIEAVIDYGRRGHRHGAIIYVVGRREINRWKRRGVDLRAHHGIHVVIDPSGKVLTAWRNRSRMAVKR